MAILSHDERLYFSSLNFSLRSRHSSHLPMRQPLPAPVGEGWPQAGVGSVIFFVKLEYYRHYRPHPLPLPLKGGELLPLCVTMKVPSAHRTIHDMRANSR